MSPLSLRVVKAWDFELQSPWFAYCYRLNLAYDCMALHIRKTCLCNADPLKPHFYIVKLGFTGVYIIFLISAQKHNLWVFVRTASLSSFHGLDMTEIMLKGM